MKPTLLLLVLLASCSRSTPPASSTPAPGDWTADGPGVHHKITLADLPPPNATKSSVNSPKEVPRPNGAMPRVPDGFAVSLYTTGLEKPRMLRAAPNGDLFVAEPSKNRIRVLRDADGDGKPEVSAIFADDLKKPFGIAFYPPADPKWVYIANTDSIVRFAYSAGDVTAKAKPEEIYGKVSGGGQLRGGGHWTRDIAFSKDGSKLFLSVGSKSNVDDDEDENRRARIFELSPDGKNERVFATGIRNAVGIAIHPDTGELWASVNERDELGDNLVPDYITSVKDGGFYGWPWFYIGKNQDPRHPGKHPELADEVIVPDLLLQAHSASLAMTFYTATQFPPAYRGAIFAAEHGSWNRDRRTGYKVIYAPVVNGKTTGEYVDFMTGFVTPDGNVWGRPVGVATGRDGALYVSDDAGDCIWRIHATAK